MSRYFSARESLEPEVPCGGPDGGPPYEPSDADLLAYAEWAERDRLALERLERLEREAAELWDVLRGMEG